MTGLFCLSIHLQLLITRDKSLTEHLCSGLRPTEVTNEIVTQLISGRQDFISNSI